MTSATGDSSRPAEAVAGLLAAGALFLGGFELLYRQFRLAPAAVLMLLIATVMSTIDAYAFIAATTVGRDLLWRLRGERPDDAQTSLSRVGLWAATAFATWLAIARPTVIGLWHDVGSVVTPTLLLPVGLALVGRGRLGPRFTLALMLLPFAVSLGWVLAKDLASSPAAAYPLSLEPIYAGLGVSLVTWLAGLALKRKELPA